MDLTDRRNLPEEVLARLAQHDDLDAAVSVVQRGRVLEGRTYTPELRVDEHGNPSFEGYATIYDYPYNVGGTYGWTEIIAPGACDKSVAERDDVRLLLNHEGIPLARTRSGTLTLKSDQVGLFCSTTPLDATGSPFVQSIVSAMKRGAEGLPGRDLDEMSFAFQVLRQQWNGDYTERTILEVRLFDVSVVTFPANPGTAALLRSSGITPPATAGIPTSLALIEDEQLLLRRR